MGKKFQDVLNAKTCKACGICAALCPKDVLKIRPDGKAEVANVEACIGCQSCSLHCPDFCFEIKEVPADD